MKKTKLLAIAAALMVMGVASACSNSSSGNSQATTVQSSANSSVAGENEEVNEAVGTISAIKNTQFVLTTDDGDALFAFETAPEGLSTVKEGDMVTVTYTGEISPVDAFTGKVISVKLYAE